jgi:hypothetical protein
MFTYVPRFFMTVDRTARECPHFDRTDYYYFHLH